MSNEQINRKLDQALGKCLAGDECECIPTDYCGSIADAFALVEWMRKERGFGFNFGGNENGWRVRIGFTDASDESLPMAISLAALEAVGSKEK